MIDIQQTGERLEAHLRTLTETIGERSVRFPEHLTKTADYIQSLYEDIGIAVHREPYDYSDFKVDNVVAEISTGPQPSRRYLLGAHYDSVSGTVGADDNASAIAVQLEIARGLKALLGREALDLAVTFVSFALEEPPLSSTLGHHGKAGLPLHGRVGGKPAYLFQISSKGALNGKTQPNMPPAPHFPMKMFNRLWCGEIP